MDRFNSDTVKGTNECSDLWAILASRMVEDPRFAHLRTQPSIICLSASDLQVGQPNDLARNCTVQRAKGKYGMRLAVPYVAQAVSLRFPIAAARVRARVRPCGIYGEQSDTGTGFLRVLRFPLPIIPPTASHSSSSIGILGWYNRPVVASVIVDSFLLHPGKGGGEG
jgi:hypothetical protein